MRKLLDYYYTWRIKRLEDDKLFSQGLLGRTEQELLDSGHVVTYRNNLKIEMYSIKRQLLYT